MSRKKYVVELSGDEREYLKAVMSKGKAAARTILKARILLEADQGRFGAGWTDESGATAIEYGLIAALVSVAAIGALGNAVANA